MRRSGGANRDLTGPVRQDKGTLCQNRRMLSLALMTLTRFEARPISIQHLTELFGNDGPREILPIDLEVTFVEFHPQFRIAQDVNKSTSQRFAILPRGPFHAGIVERAARVLATISHDRNSARDPRHNTSALRCNSAADKKQYVRGFEFVSNLFRWQNPANQKFDIAPVKRAR